MVFFEVYNLDIRQYMGTYFYSFKTVVLKSVFLCKWNWWKCALSPVPDTHLKDKITISKCNMPPCPIAPMSPLPPLPPLPPCSHCLHWKYYSIASVKIKSAKVDAHSLSAYWRNSTTVCITLYIHKCNALGMQPCKTFSEVFSFSGFYDLKSAMVIFKSILQYFCFT